MTCFVCGAPTRANGQYREAATPRPAGVDAQTADLIAALAEVNIHSRGDLVLLLDRPVLTGSEEPRAE